MNRPINSTAQTIDLARARPETGADRPARLLVAAALIFGIFSVSTARADSFFDVYVDLWNSGNVVMSPISSEGAFPFPPPPLNFPDLDTAAGTVDIEMVSLSLRSSKPMVVGSPDPTSGSFYVDSFFDIEYQINVDDGTGPSNFYVDSFLARIIHGR